MELLKLQDRKNFDTKKSKIRVYLASPFWSPEANHALAQMEEVFMDNPNFEAFSPRLFGIGDGDTINDEKWDKIFQENVTRIQWADYVIVNTTGTKKDANGNLIGSDTGTIWETGASFAWNKKVVYYNPFLGDNKFNVMLAKSGHATCTTYEDLVEFAKNPEKQIKYNGKTQ
mgnify:CR=1 FL=1